jgi:hypothetical protein
MSGAEQATGAETCMLSASGYRFAVQLSEERFSDAMMGYR